MIKSKSQSFIEKHYWIHAVFWLLYSIYLFANPPLYKWGVKPVIFTAIWFYITYGGAYLFAVKMISPKFFQKKKIGKGLLLVLVTASAQQLLFQPVSNYFLPFNEPFMSWFLLNLPFSCLVILLASGVTVFTDYLYVVRKIQTMEIAKAKQEILLLKSQINPHFLFNTLNNLYVLAISKSDKAGKAILELSGLMRYLTEISKREFVSLEEEISFLKSYVEMEKLRLNDDAICVLHILPNNYDQYKLPPLLLLPFVENAFKHGAENNPERVDIQLYVTIQDNVLYFEVNNSIYTSGARNSSSGTGLINLKQRLELLFKDKYKLELSEIENRFIAKLSIHLT